MSWNHLIVWDRNRSTHFLIGIVISIGFSHILINMETDIPHYGDYKLSESEPELNALDIKSHSDITPKSLRQITKTKPLVAKIIPVPFLETNHTLSKIEPNNADISFKNKISNIEISSNHPIVEPIDKKTENTNSTVLNMADEMPYLISCGDNDLEEEKRNCTKKLLLSHLIKNLKYPAIARETEIEGIVIISFVIDRNGNLKDIEIIRDIGGGCGAAAIKVIKQLTNWVPGKHNHQPVNVKYVIPVKFKLSS